MKNVFGSKKVDVRRISKKVLKNEILFAEKKLNELLVQYLEEETLNLVIGERIELGALEECKRKIKVKMIFEDMEAKMWLIKKATFEKSKERKLINLGKETVNSRYVIVEVLVDGVKRTGFFIYEITYNFDREKIEVESVLKGLGEFLLTEEGYVVETYEDGSEPNVGGSLEEIIMRSIIRVVDDNYIKEKIIKCYLKSVRNDKQILWERYNQKVKLISVTNQAMGTKEIFSSDILFEKSDFPDQIVACTIDNR